MTMALTLYLVGLLRASVQRSGSGRVEPALASDDGRDPTEVARELGVEESLP